MRQTASTLSHKIRLATTSLHPCCRGASSNPKLCREHLKFCLTLTSRHRKLTFYVSVFQWFVYNPLEVLWLFLGKAGNIANKNKSVLTSLIFAVPFGFFFRVYKTQKLENLCSRILQSRH